MSADPTFASPQAESLASELNVLDKLPDQGSGADGAFTVADVREAAQTRIKIKPGKRYGLILALGGAPATPHVIAGVPGHVRPDVPTPVGEEGELPIEEAVRLVDEIDVLDLVEITSAEADQAKALTDETVEAIRKGLADAAQVADGAEVTLINDEKAAVAAAKE